MHLHIARPAALAALAAALFAAPLRADEGIDPAWYGDGGADSPYALKTREYDPGFSYTPSPAQWRDRNIYQLFTDRFANDGVDRLASYKPHWRYYHSGDGINRSFPFNRNFHHGGSWNGLKLQIPYLKGMGVTAVWISGVQQNDQGATDRRWTPYHQYHVDNFFACDPAMGTFAELKDLIDTLHREGIAVILDVAPNHMCDKNGWGTQEEDKSFHWDDGGKHWWDENNKHCTPFDSLDRFHVQGTINNWDTSPENLIGQFKGTDDLKQEDPYTSEILYKAFKNLIDATDCDGFRVDAIKHVPYDWCRSWAQAIRDHAAWRGKANFLMFGELFSYDTGALASWCSDGYGFNSALMFPLMQAMNNVFGNGYSSYELGEKMNLVEQYGAGKENVIAFLDNHDVNRFAQAYGGGSKDYAVRIMRPAMTFLYLAPPLPLLYYGTEHAFNQGGHGNGTDRSWDDSNPDDGDWQRECMFWCGDDGFQPGNAYGDMFSDDAKNAGLYYHIAWLNSLRNKSRALRRGGFQQRYASGGQGIYAFTKWYDNEVALVVVNTADGPQDAWIDAGKANTVYRENGDGDSVTSEADNKIHVSIDGKGTKIYICNFEDHSADIAGGGSSPALWARGTYGYPTESATTADTIYVNTEAGSQAAIDDGAKVYLIYAFNNPDGEWPKVEMEKNAEWSSADGYWFHYSLGNLSTGRLDYVICVEQVVDGVTNTFWDNNGGSNFVLEVSAAPDPADFAFHSLSHAPVAAYPGDDIAITAVVESDPETDLSALATTLSVDLGDGWTDIPMPVVSTYTNVDTNGLPVAIWTYTSYTLHAVPAGTIRYKVAASNEGPVVQANHGNPTTVSVAYPAVPDGLAITTPASSPAVAATNAADIKGTAGDDVVSDIFWTNTLTGGSGSISNAPLWNASVPLAVGSNLVTFSAATGGSAIVTNGADSASAYSTWKTGDNLGAGFGPWTLETKWSESAPENAGCFLDGAFGMWSSTGFEADAYRDISGGLQPGETFHIFFRNGWILGPGEAYADAPGASVGFAFLDVVEGQDSNIPWQFFFNGGSSTYASTDGDTGIPWTDAGIQIDFTLLTATSYQVVLTPAGGEAKTFTGTLSDPIDAIRVWTYSNGIKGGEGNENRNLYFDHLARTAQTSTPAGTATASVVLVYGNAPADERLGVPVEWLQANGIDPDAFSADSRTIASSPYSDREKYFADLSPTNDDRLAILSFSAESLSVYKASDRSIPYVVEYATDLAPAEEGQLPDWNWVPTVPVSSADGALPRPEPATPASRILYRVKVDIPAP